MNALRVDQKDNVAVILASVGRGDTVEYGGSHAVTALNDIAQGHKIALEDIPKGADIIKYGVPIGKASAAIRAGEHVHTHNVLDVTEELCERYAREFRQKGGARG